MDRDKGPSKAELERYSRHLLLPEFGKEGQEKLRNSSVLVIGAGGLGAPVILYLAAAGVGRIRIVDPDRVADHNLQRQVLFESSDVGKKKAVLAKARAEALNPWIDVEAEVLRIDSGNAMELLEGMDLLIDGSDNFPTRYLANDASVLAGIPNVHASVFRFEGQIAVFGGPAVNGKRAADYRDLFPKPPPPGSVPGCNEGGVLGVLPGIMGSMQANEAIKLLAGIGEPLKGELLIYDALRAEMRKLRIPKDPSHPGIDRLIDHEAFCGILPDNERKKEGTLRRLTAEELKGMMDRREEFQLIDVREKGERDIVHIGGAHVPMDRLGEELEGFSDGIPIIFYCRSGKRSERAAKLLKEQRPDAEVLDLEGGVLAWIERVDPSLPSY